MFINPQSEYKSKLNNIFNTTQGKGVSLFHCNIRSWTKNLTLLNDVLYSLDSRPDIVAITETRLSSNSISNLDIPNYNVFHTDSPTRAGGALIYVNKVLKAIPRPDLKIDLPLVESCWVEIDPNNNRKHIMIGCICKHPPANVEEFTLKQTQSKQIWYVYNGWCKYWPFEESFTPANREIPWYDLLPWSFTSNNETY